MNFNQIDQPKEYAELTADIINDLKARGFKYIRTELLYTGDIRIAIVEIIPMSGGGSEPGLTSLSSSDIAYYIEGAPSAKYLIDKSFLVPA
jgi:hypothetical protein